MKPDVLVVGAGVFGLSVAFAARRAGLSVLVLESGRIGDGAASGGPVGALAPHAPGRWGELQAFQLAALASLPDRVGELEAESGVPVGYARIGRVVPLTTAAARVRAESDAAAAPARWGTAGRYEVLDRLPAEAEGWVTPGAATHGAARDTLSARIGPGGYLSAMAACLGGSVREGVAVRAIDPDGPAALTGAGRIPARAVVIAAGWRSWKLAQPLAPGLIGEAVKGQAALLGLDAPGRPLLTGDGLYIVPHARGVAVGSTNEGRFTHPEPDALLDELIARARRLCLPLADAPVLRRWAGLRPKPPGRAPVAGPLSGASGVWIAGSGFRIGLAIAHAVGDGLAAEIAGGEQQLPASFRP